MFDTNLVTGTDDRTLQEAPNALDAVGVNVADNPFLNRVINGAMLRVGIFNSPIGRKLIGIDGFRVWRGVVANKLLQNVFGRMRYDLQPNHAAALDCSNRDSLIRLVATSMPSHLAANIRFIDFHDAPQKV